MGDALCFFRGFSSLPGEIVLLLLRKMAPGGRVSRPMSSAWLVLVGVGMEGLDWESNRTTPACPRDVAISSALVPPRSGMSGLRSFRSNSNFTIPSSPKIAPHQSGVRPCWVSGVLGLRSSRSSNNLTIPSYPPSAAHQSGV